MINRLLQTVRFSEWGSTKLIECIIVYFIYRQAGDGYLDLQKVIASFFFVASYLAFGYFINDLSDMAADRQAGKVRGVHDLSPINIFLIGLILMITNISSIYFIYSYHLRLFIIFCVLSYFSMLGYSLPPLRFKERGFTGLMVAAVGQRTLPAMVLIAGMRTIEISVLLYLALLTVNGLRWIIIHQILDLKNDIETGIRTYAVTKSAVNMKRIMSYIVFPLEIGLGLVLTLYFVGSACFLPLAVYWIGMPVYALLWHRYFGKVSLFSYDYAPGANFIFLILPIVFLLAYSISEPIGWVFLALTIFLKWNYILWQVKNVFALIRFFLRNSLVKG